MKFNTVLDGGINTVACINTEALKLWDIVVTLSTKQVDTGQFMEMLLSRVAIVIHIRATPLFPLFLVLHRRFLPSYGHDDRRKLREH